MEAERQRMVGILRPRSSSFGSEGMTCELKLFEMLNSS